MESNESLFGRYLDGDEAGLCALIERYGDSLTAYLNGIVHNMQDAEDLMIEAFSRVAAKRPRLTENGFKPYLYKTGRNLAKRRLEKRFTAVVFSLDEIPALSLDANCVETALQTTERNRLIHLCMGSLHKAYRETLYLLYFEGMSYAESAAVLGKTEKQIANFATRGRQALRVLLEREGIFNT